VTGVLLSPDLGDFFVYPASYVVQGLPCPAPDGAGVQGFAGIRRLAHRSLSVGGLYVVQGGG